MMVDDEEFLISGRGNEGEGLYRLKSSDRGVRRTKCWLLCSKSNTAAGEIQIKLACQKSWQIAPKNEDISKSVNSIDSGAIFPSS